jgi:hypothetical protein
VAVCDELIEDELAATAIPVMVTGVDATPMLMDAEPDLVLSSVEVAVQVPVPVAEGVKTPPCVMVPPVADHVTPVPKFPLPATEAVQVEVWPSSMEAGAATTVTELIWLPWPFTFSEPLADFLASCLDVAVIVSRPDAGAEIGAV